jgi:prepilin-type N-terminal cleavage/methylation domain-containing protein
MIIYKIPRRFTSRNDTSRISSEASINQRGFTLLEIILAIAATAVIAVVAGMGLVEMTKGYIFSKKNAFIAQQGQIAMARLKKEMRNIMSVTSVTPTPPSITYTRSSDAPPRPSHTISWAGGSSPLLIDGDTLVMPVSSFSLNFYNKFDDPSPSAYSSTTTSMIEMTLQLTGAENAAITFNDRVNLYLETGGI